MIKVNFVDVLMKRNRGGWNIERKFKVKYKELDKIEIPGNIITDFPSPIQTDAQKHEELMSIFFKIQDWDKQNDIWSDPLIAEKCIGDLFVCPGDRERFVTNIAIRYNLSEKAYIRKVLVWFYEHEWRKRADDKCKTINDAIKNYMSAREYKAYIRWCNHNSSHDPDSIWVNNHPFGYYKKSLVWYETDGKLKQEWERIKEEERPGDSRCP